MKSSGNDKISRSGSGRSREGNSLFDGTSLAALKRKKRRKARTVLSVLLLVFLALCVAAYAYIKFGVQPPAMKPKLPSGTTGTASGSSLSSAPSDRKGNQYTFLILGVSGGNTDTMMVANFDADTHKLNAVSIPRDTLVNVAWYTKKINSLYPNKGMDGVLSGVSDILGFQVDFYMLVDLEAFTELVDAVGGVDFNVPVDMNYEDPAQDLYIHLKKGVQHLDGATAIKVVRCRSVYSTADIGRIGTQQAFLKAAAEQILEKQNQLNLTELANIFTKYVKTDLTAGNLIWLAKEFYKVDSSGITFTTIPANDWDSVNGDSYVTIYVSDWLKLLNTAINPFKQNVKAGDLSILTRDDNGDLYVTNGVWAGKQSWGAGSAASSAAEKSSTTEESASPSHTASPSPSPSGTTKPSATSSASPSASIKPTPSPSTGEAKTSPTASPSASSKASAVPSPSASTASAKVSGS